VTLPPSGQTTIAGIIGHPVRQSLSPAIHNAAYAALGLDWVYVAFPVAPGTVRDALVGLQAAGVAGCNVTMPHKTEAAHACDELTPAAAALDAVNTVTLQDGPRRGDSTDGDGFIDATEDAGIDLATRVLVLGAGGAARAIVQALGARRSEVTVAARRPDAAAAAAALAPSAVTVAFDELDDAVGGTDVVVNATPLGMCGEAPPFDPTRLHAGQVVIDTVYAPPVTPLLDAAAAQGARTLNGLGMLVHQAARSFTRLTGQPAPLEAMRAAVS
jgi:shikimate dehydrogenase